MIIKVHLKERKKSNKINGLKPWIQQKLNSQSKISIVSLFYYKYFFFYLDE